MSQGKQHFPKVEPRKTCKFYMVAILIHRCIIIAAEIGQLLPSNLKSRTVFFCFLLDVMTAFFILNVNFMSQVIKHFRLFLLILFFQLHFFPLHWQFKYYNIEFCSDFVWTSWKFERHGYIKRHVYNWKQPLFQWRDSQNHPNTTWHNQYCDNF